MRKTGKRIGLTISSLVLCVSGAFAYASMQTPAEKASAASGAQTASVDVLGNFTWNKVDGATGYTWSYTIDGETSDTFTAEENQANVGVAVMEAVNAAKSAGKDSASVTFSVTPTGVSGATAAVYSHTVDKYINFGYSSHDIADVDVAYKNGVRLYDELSSETVVDNRWLCSAVYKNDLLTMAYQTDVPLDGTHGVSFFLFGDKRSVGDTALTANFNYRIRLRASGAMDIYNRGDEWSPTQSDAVTTDNVAIEVGTRNYFSMGVFDTYDVKGNIIGETVYCQRSVYDEALDCLRSVGEIEHTYTTAEVQAAGIAYEYTPVRAVLDDEGYKRLEEIRKTNPNANTELVEEQYKLPVERSTLVVKMHGSLDKDGDTEQERRENYAQLYTGRPTYEKTAAPTGLYYDNTDQTLSWNSVEGASGYEWRVGNGAWIFTARNQASIASEIQQNTRLGFMQISVRAITGNGFGATAAYNVNLKQFYKEKSVLMDLTELYEYANDPAVSYNVNTNSGAKNGGKQVKAPGLVMNTHTAFAFTTKENTPAQEKIVMLRLFREESSNFYSGHYALAIWGDGTVILTPNHAQTTGVDTTSARTNMASTWRIAKITDGFKTGVKYYVTFGVDEILDGETKVANRVTLRIEEGNSNNLSRKTIGVLRYDFKHYARQSEGDWMQLGAHSDVVSLWQTKNENVAADVYVMRGEEVFATRQIAYGAAYDFRDLLSSINVAGYAIEGWQYFDGENRADFPAYGKWNISSMRYGVLVEPIVSDPIWYNVTYSGLNGGTSINPAKYTIESDWTLNAPTNIPEGKVFDGWYLADDTDFSEPITSLKGKTGDLELVARFVSGYTIKVDGVEHVWEAVNGAFTLNAAPVNGKTFQKWQVLNGSSYVDYTGAITFTPSKNMTFKSVYEWTTYSISYVADGGSHENATTYTGETPVTFTAAKKDGYFFVGWYTDTSFTNQITDTAGYAENLTVYAKFMQSALPKTASLDTSDKLQALPVLNIPEGARYSVALYKGSEKLSDNSEYLFDTAGEYVIEYTIVLPSGENFSHEIALTVKQVYTVTIHYGDDETVSVRKYAGESLNEDEVPELPEGMIFGGLYKDAEYTQAFDIADAISSDMDIYVQWRGLETEEKSNNGWIIGGIVGGSVIVLLGAGAAVFFVLKKRKK